MMANAKQIARIFEYLGMKSEGTPVEKTRLNKLLFFAQGHALAELGHGLFQNQIDAWSFGPVVAVVYTGFEKILEDTKKNGISDIQIAPDELDIIMDVWDHYHLYTATELVTLTHEQGTPWQETYKPGEKNIHISIDLIKRFFELPQNRLIHAKESENKLPIINVLPAEEYDPDEDSVWEALLNDTQ